jgi:hypothetical protein
MRLKRKAGIDAKERRIAHYARLIAGKDALDILLLDAQPHLRPAVFERIRPYLKFPITAAELPCLRQTGKP